MIPKMLAHASKLIVLAAGIVLAGCQSANLISLDNEWRQTYIAMQNPDFLVSGTVYPAQLADLSDRAAAAGAKAASSDPQTAIGFYRLAALAAWKSGELRADKVVEVADAGNALCSKLPNSIASQPRDCSILLVAPAFALHDREARLYADLLKAAPNPRPLSPQDLAAARGAIGQLSVAFNTVATVRDRTRDLNLPVSFNRDFLDFNWSGVYCTATGVYGLINRNEPNEQMLGAAILAMQQTLISSNIPPTCPS